MTIGLDGSNLLIDRQTTFFLIAFHPPAPEESCTRLGGEVQSFPTTPPRCSESLGRTTLLSEGAQTEPNCAWRPFACRRWRRSGVGLLLLLRKECPSRKIVLVSSCWVREGGTVIVVWERALLFLLVVLPVSIARPQICSLLVVVYGVVVDARVRSCSSRLIAVCSVPRAEGRCRPGVERVANTGRSEGRTETRQNRKHATTSQETRDWTQRSKIQR